MVAAEKTLAIASKGIAGNCQQLPTPPTLPPPLIAMEMALEIAGKEIAGNCQQFLTPDFHFHGNLQP